MEIRPLFGDSCPAAELFPHLGTNGIRFLAANGNQRGAERTGTTVTIPRLLRMIRAGARFSLAKLNLVDAWSVRRAAESARLPLTRTASRDDLGFPIWGSVPHLGPACLAATRFARLAIVHESISHAALSGSKAFQDLPRIVSTFSRQPLPTGGPTVALHRSPSVRLQVSRTG